MAGAIPAAAVPGPVAFLLLLLSIAVLTVGLDRLRWWLQWWRGRNSRRRLWQEALAADGDDLDTRLEEWDLAMAFGDPLLRSAAVLAPLLGLTGTVLGLMEVLGRLGPDLVLPAGASLQGYGRVLLSTALGLLLSALATALLHANQGLHHWQLGRLARQLQRQRRSQR